MYHRVEAVGDGRFAMVPIDSLLSYDTEAGRWRIAKGERDFGDFGRDFATKDGKTLMLLAITPKQWSKALEALGLSREVAALEGELGVSFAVEEGLRFTHRDRLYPMFERAFAAKNGDHTLFFSADDDAPFGASVEAMDLARTGGATPINVLTVKPKG